MFDDKPVHHAMERIFAPLDVAEAPPPTSGHSRSIRKIPGPRRRWFMGRDGIAAAGFALAITGIGLVMAPLLSAPAGSPPPARIAAPAQPVVPVSPPRPVPVPPPVVASAPPAANPVPPPRIVKTARARPLRRYARPRHVYHRRSSPRLAGAALRRALARDVVLTRRLNQEALRRLPPAPR